MGWIRQQTENPRVSGSIVVKGSSQDRPCPSPFPCGPKKHYNWRIINKLYGFFGQKWHPQFFHAIADNLNVFLLQEIRVWD